MQISSLSGLYQANFFLDPEKTEKRTSPLEAGERKGDTVTISEEALALARNMAAGAASREGSETSTHDRDEKAQEQALGMDRKSGMVLNGQWADEKDILAQIKRTEEEVDELTEALELIMGADAPLEEKLRLSEPPRKQLEDKLKELTALRGMAEALKNNKSAEVATPSATGL